VSLPTYDLLIVTIPHRHEKLLGLLAELDRQITFGGSYYSLAGVGALLYRDNLTVPYGDKTRLLLRASEADYVSCLDDDDMLAPDGLSRIMAALRTRPDYVGFTVRWTNDGQEMIPAEHSLRHPDWQDRRDILLRSVAHFNPIRREYALDGTWSGGYEADRRWQAGVLAAGRVRTEAWLPPPPVYWYRSSPADHFLSNRQPVPPGEIPPLPSYPWLTVLTWTGSV
jgi:hypothetical protein